MKIRKNIYGAYMISDVVNGYWVGQTYYGYTKREAISLFKSYLKGVK